MPYYRAAWLLPISQPPIRDAWLRTDRGRIVAYGHSHPGDLSAAGEIDLGQVAVLPGLVNAHTHLELSWMRGRIAESGDFPTWVRSVIALSRENGGNGAPPHVVDEAIDEARRFGTSLLGDISNSLTTSGPLAARGMPAVVFHELLGFKAGDAPAVVAAALDRLRQVPGDSIVRHALAPHAPYSVSPALFGAIRQTLATDPFARSSVHLGESAAETEFLKTGRGPFRRLLEDLGAWDPAFVAPKCAPADYLDRMGFLDGRVLVVHGVHLDTPDLALLARKGASLVTCPRGNIRTGAGAPPVEEFFASGVRVAVGTDSLASVPDLNLFAELAELRRLAPAVPARLLLEAATINGARALGFDAELGSIDAGKRDALVAVELDATVSSVEEAMMEGVDASRISWLPS